MTAERSNATEPGWYAVRCVFEVDGGSPRTYEERITVWQAAGTDEAIALAEDEAREYAEGIDATYLGLAQGYQLFERPSHGAEVFSLMRDSELPPSAYLNQFFDTGTERQH